MLKHVLSRFGAGVLVIAGCVIWNQRPGRAAQLESPRPVPRPFPISDISETPLDSSVAMQMFALDRHARMDMVLSAGSGARRAADAPVLSVVVMSAAARK
jgi:hypothetical protein